VFLTANGAGSAALLAVGVYFVLAVLLRRFPKLKVGDTEIDPSLTRIVRHATAKSEQATEEAENAKEGVRALLERSPLDMSKEVEGDAVGTSIDPRILELAASYNELRWTMPSGPVRTDRMTQIFNDMIARLREMGGGDYKTLLNSEDRGLRLAGIASLNVRPTPSAIPELVELGVTPDRAFNEYWALATLSNLLVGKCHHLNSEMRRRLEERLMELPRHSDRASAIRTALRECP
jgi:hypothetical protein